MLTEKDYCDYETCVALKELGYNDSTDLRYNDSNSLGDFFWIKIIIICIKLLKFKIKIYQFL